MLVQIKRQLHRQSSPFFQTFEYNGPLNISVASLLSHLNLDDNLVDINDNRAHPIEWECSCLQKSCGGCAMVINNTPALACSVFLSDLSAKDITIEPLSVFPVIQDLRVDRRVIFDRLIEMELWVEDVQPPKINEYKYQYNSAKCLKCGLCLEVCPNYTCGNNVFYGPVVANESYLTHSQNGNKEARKNIHKNFEKKFNSHCSKSFACNAVCPLLMKPLSSIGFMNRT